MQEVQKDTCFIAIWERARTRVFARRYIAGTGEEEDQYTVWYTTSNGIEHSDPAYKCVAEEGDTGVWYQLTDHLEEKKLIQQSKRSERS